MVSYNKLLRFEQGQLEIKAKLSAVLELKGQVGDHELRLVALEQIQAIDLAKQSVWGKVRTFVYGVGSTILVILTAVIAGGYLPKLWG